MLTEELLATAKQAESAQNVAGLSPPNYSAGVQSEVSLLFMRWQLPFVNCINQKYM
jgi:hypothetical protein